MQSSSELIFTALGDPTRRGIYQHLSQKGALSVHVLTQLSGISQPAVSKHLAQLKKAGLVGDQKRGRETYYGIETQGLEPLKDWIATYSHFWHARLDQLDDLLTHMD